MTITELEKILRIDRHKVDAATREVAAKLPSLSAKIHNNKLYRGSNLTLEEIDAICEIVNCNPLQLQFIHEQFKAGPAPDIYEIRGTHQFLEGYKRNPKIKCCNTCKHLCGMTGNNKMPQPYCKAYDDYLRKLDAKVYEDWCSSYIYIELPKPRQWFKENAPINLNIYGETGTINGIDNSKMMNKERSIKGVVTRVNQVGFDS